MVEVGSILQQSQTYYNLLYIVHKLHNYMEIRYDCAKLEHILCIMRA